MKAEPLLLIPGLAGTPRVWEPLCAHLPADVTVLPLDCYRPGGAPLASLAGLAGRLADELERRRVDCERLRIVTHSMGGLLALHLLPRLSAGPASLCLLAPTALRPADVLPPAALWRGRGDLGALLYSVTRRSFSAGFIRGAGSLLRHLYEELPGDQLQDLVAAQLAAIEGMGAPPLIAPALRPPLLAVVAPGDRVVPAGHGQATATALGAQLLALPAGYEHGFPIEAPAETAALLVRWWAALSAGDAAAPESTAPRTQAR